VKAECKAVRSEVATRTELLTRGLQRYGFTYRVVPDHELSRQPRLDNAKILLRYGRRTASDNEREYVRLALKSKGYLSWSEVCRGVLGTHGREIVCRLVIEGVLSFDVDLPLGPSTQFLERRNH